jgi:glycosyltransferase involved in cell wall biosynthesis
MLLSLGHDVFYYGAEGSDVPCTEFIETHSLADIRMTWGDEGADTDIGYDYKAGEFRHDFCGEVKPVTLRFRAKCIEEVKKRACSDDFLLLTQGLYHKPIADALHMFLTIEPGIGYRGSYARFRSFESSFIQNFIYGSEHPYESISGHYYDRVIPNYFDPDDIEFQSELVKRDPKDEYYLFIGRMIKRKGIITATRVCDILGKKLLIAGQGGKVMPDGSLVAAKDTDFIIPPGTWKYVGCLDLEDRKTIMSNALATFTPTEYLEPFAGTHIESMLSGTPPITTNFGVFPETIPDFLNGAVGFRCNTLQDFICAAIRAPLLPRTTIHNYARRFFMDNVAWEFQNWFDDLYAVWESAVDEDAKIPNPRRGWNRICFPDFLKEELEKVPMIDNHYIPLVNSTIHHRYPLTKDVSSLNLKAHTER